MHRSHATRRPDDTGGHPHDPFPKPRPAPAARERPDPLRQIEDEVARFANVVLMLWALADRYEERLRRLAPGQPGFAEQQTRVATLRTTAERGRRRLEALGGSG
jgi:hypothetical protein